MNYEVWWVLRRDNGAHLGTHVLHRTTTKGRHLRDCVAAWSDSGPVCLYNTATGEVWY